MGWQSSTPTGGRPPLPGRLELPLQRVDHLACAQSIARLVGMPFSVLATMSGRT